MLHLFMAGGGKSEVCLNYKVGKTWMLMGNFVLRLLTNVLLKTANNNINV